MIAVACIAVLACWAGLGVLEVPVRAAPVGARRSRRIRRPTGVDGEALIAMLDTLAAELRSGASLGTARRRAEAAHPRAPQLDAAAADADIALTLQALDAAALGGAPAAAIDAAAATLRDRRSVRLERRAQAAQARLSALVLTAVPPMFALWAAATSVSTRRVYTDSSLGVTVLALGAALNVTGWCWMRRLTTGAGHR